MAIDSVVVIGTSLGGVEALQRLVSKLPSDFASAMLVVQHVGNHPSKLPEILTQRGPIRAKHAVEGERIQPGRILLAPPDRHMLVDGDVIQLTHGPKEHHTRPAIDPLFLSAALSRGPGVVGVILTGRGSDGTAGLQAIKECGGVTIVQDPTEALVPDMPRSASHYVDIDHCVKLDELPELLTSLVSPREIGRRGAPATPPPNLQHEHDLTLSKGDPMEHLKAIATPSPFACPECSGGLWEVTNAQPPRYRCHTGHGYTLDTLQETQSNETDAALWSAIRALQEKSHLMQMMATIHRNAGEESEATAIEAEMEKAKKQASLIRELVEKYPQLPEP
jgi:two-component system chemotaxis response regulator CheB